MRAMIEKFQQLKVAILVSPIVLTSVVSGQQFEVPTLAPESVGLSLAILANIDTVVAQAIENKEFSGAVILVARHGKIAYHKAFGFADRDTPMQTNAIFRLASMTKTVTAVAMMQLVEQGKIELVDPVSKYIPEFKNPRVLVLNPEGSDSAYTFVPAKREVLIHDLLAMTSGHSQPLLSVLGGIRAIQARMMADAGLNEGNASYEMSLEKHAKIIAQMPLTDHPGELYEYGVGPDVAAYIVEVITGVAYDKYLEANIFQPLRMTDTGYYPSAVKVERLTGLFATGSLEKLSDEAFQSGEAYLSANDPYGPHKSFFGGATGLTSTAFDYFRFAQMLLNKGQLNGVRILSRKSVEIMTTNQIGDLIDQFYGNKWGYGISIQANASPSKKGAFYGSVGAYGSSGLWGTRFVVNPKDRTVLIMMTPTFALGGVESAMVKIAVVTSSAVID